MLKNRIVTSLAICASTLLLSGCASDSPIVRLQNWMEHHSSPSATTSYASNEALPSLVVTEEAPPEVIYRRGMRDTVIASDMSTPVRSLRGQRVETLVTRKVGELARDLRQLERNTGGFQNRLNALQAKNDGAAAKYYELVAAINTELQAGTTPGNPMLVERWNVAQDRLDTLAQNAGQLNSLATDLSNESSKAAYLQDNIRATYSLSGAVKEDHAKLRNLEDGVNQSIVGLNRLLTSVSDEIQRRNAYMRSEKLNLQTLSLGIANGELYGQNLTNSLFKKAAADGQAIFGDAAPKGKNAKSLPSRRPLVIIRFDRTNVNYEQALYSAVGQALEKYPSARFDLVAVSAAEGNPAEKALASTEARKNGETVLRSLTQMGLPMERIRLNAANSKSVRNSEVHLYLQ